MMSHIETCAIFLDVDGTLIDFADAPDGVRLPHAVPKLVDTLVRSTDGAVALVSGRSLSDIDRLFPGRGLPAAGQHGLERRSADGRRSQHAYSSKPLDKARAILARAIARHPRLLLEDKGLSLALHYRRAPRFAGFAYRLMHSLRDALGDRYCVHGGKRVVSSLQPAGTKARRSERSCARRHFAGARRSSSATT